MKVGILSSALNGVIMHTWQKTRQVLGVMIMVIEMQHFIDAGPNAKA